MYHRVHIGEVKAYAQSIDGLDTKYLAGRPPILPTPSEAYFSSATIRLEHLPFSLCVTNTVQHGSFLNPRLHHPYHLSYNQLSIDISYQHEKSHLRDVSHPSILDCLPHLISQLHRNHISLRPRIFNCPSFIPGLRGSNTPTHYFSPLPQFNCLCLPSLAP